MLTKKMILLFPRSCLFGKGQIPRVSILLGLLLLSDLQRGIGQQQTTEKLPGLSQPLSLRDAVEYALANYPAVRAAVAQASAASTGVDLARTAYLPKTDLVWQANRATRNNVFGLYFPAPVPLPISGPVLGTNNGTNVWGTATGFLFSWEPFDFGLRRARVDSARAQESQASAGVAVTRLETGVSGADAFLTLLAAQQSVRAVRANVTRTEVLFRSIETLVKSELRPGADLARAKAELAAAQNQLIEAEQTEQISRARLAQILGVAGNSVAIQAGGLQDSLPSAPFFSPSLSSHALAAAQVSTLNVVKARQNELGRVYFPHFDLQAATFGRGTGALTNGQVLGGFNGLSPNTFNWAVGFSARFQLFDVASLRRRKEIERDNESVENARFDLVLQNLTTQAEKAKAEWEGARRIAENIPIQLEAARTAEQQVRTRYLAGLSTLVEVADAQRVLTQSEIENSLSRLRVWRALLAVAAAQGSLEPFLEQVSKANANQGSKP